MAIYNGLIVRAYGKINLLLDVVGLRNDGYHMLNTVMQTVDLYDTLELRAEEGSGIEILCDKEGFPKDETNLIWRAADTFAKFTKTDLGHLTVKVDKALPSQAGMGGGSADCAAMLRALNTLYCTLLDEDQLLEMAAGLGADVPFCLLGGTRLCQGIGEITHKLPSPDCAFLIVKPEVSISTPEAFRKYDALTDPRRSRLDNFLLSLASGNLYSTCIYLFNALEYAADVPEIQEAKADLKAAGALESCMTGSGSAVFGVFDHITHAQAAAEKLKEKYPYCQTASPRKEPYELVKVL